MSEKKSLDEVGKFLIENDCEIDFQDKEGIYSDLFSIFINEENEYAY